MMRRTCGSEDGSSTLETALACTILLMIVFGMIQMGQGLYAYHYIAEAARIGTRFAIVRGSSCSGLTGGCPATAANVSTYIKGQGYGVIPADLTVTTTWPTTGTACTPTASPCDNPGNMVQVQVQYIWAFSIPFIKTPIALNMSSTSAMVISQ